MIPYCMQSKKRPYRLPLLHMGIDILAEAQTKYYRTEVKKIDIARINSNYVDFACECKYIYASDFIVTNSQLQNHVIITLDHAFKQLHNYTNNTHARNNNLVVLNMLCAPHGTNGYLASNSGIKYFNKNRLQHDASLIQTNNINSLPSILDNKIINNRFIQATYQGIKCRFQQCAKLYSCLGFDYYIITLAYEA